MSRYRRSRDAGGLRVLHEDLLEARSVALGPLHDLRLVAVRFFDEPRRIAARAGHDVVRVRLAFVAEALAILAALTASSNAACTLSGGCTLCSVTFCT
jgi:hypothetical protein